MRVATEDLTSHPEDPTRHFGFEKKTGGDFTLRPGPCDWTKLDPAERTVYLDFDEPKWFCWPHLNPRDTAEPKFHRILTVCPYTTEWLNAKQGRKRRIPIFFPVNPEYVPPPGPKDLDVVYCGHMLHWQILRTVTDLTRFRYAWVSRDSHPYVTHSGSSYREKLEVIARSRISVVHNLVFLAPKYIRNSRQIADIQNNKAFSEVAKCGDAVPQLKSRLFEAAFCRSLILCRRDPWNVIERHFAPEKEFVYYEDGFLAQTIARILRDFGRYQPIIENAYIRAAREYTTDAFFEKYLAHLE